MEKRWRYELRLQNGAVVADSAENGEFFESEADADCAGWDFAEEWLDSQDCEEDDRFAEGDVRVWTGECGRGLLCAANNKS